MKNEKNTANSNSSRDNIRSCEHLSFAAKEAFKRLRTNLSVNLSEKDTGHVIGVTSAQPSEGKSTIALNLAYSLAELGKKVILIDGDMRRPTVHEKTGVERVPGLSDLMTSSGDISSALRKYRSSTDDTIMDVLPGGNIPKNPSELLNSERMAALLKTLSSAYDFVIVDLPPIGAVTDAIAISREIEGMIVVIRENNCPRGLFADCMRQLEYSGVNVLGFVVNGAMEGSGKKYQYGKYGSYGNYSYYY